MLNRVTITGADDNTDISAIMDLTFEFPFVEWGILVSKKLEGGPRFPTHKWIERFEDCATQCNAKVSVHMCGRWVRDLLKGQLNWNEAHPSLIETANRIQINTHAEPHEMNVDAFMANLMRPLVLHQYIFQVDGVNFGYDNEFNRRLTAAGIDNVPLFDLSGGAGLLPDRGWPLATKGLYCGYAGGLGPDTIEEQLPRIEISSQGQNYWIDMESRVRTDEELDLDKVRSVLKVVERSMKV